MEYIHPLHETPSRNKDIEVSYVTTPKIPKNGIDCHGSKQTSKDQHKKTPFLPLAICLYSVFGFGKKLFQQSLDSKIKKFFSFYTYKPGLAFLIIVRFCTGDLKNKTHL